MGYYYCEKTYDYLRYVAVLKWNCSLRCWVWYFSPTQPSWPQNRLWVQQRNQHSPSKWLTLSLGQLTLSGLSTRFSNQGEVGGFCSGCVLRYGRTTSYYLHHLLFFFTMKSAPKHSLSIILLLPFCLSPSNYEQCLTDTQFCPLMIIESYFYDWYPFCQPRHLTPTSRSFLNLCIF